MRGSFYTGGHFHCSNTRKSFYRRGHFHCSNTRGSFYKRGYFHCSNTISYNAIHTARCHCYWSVTESFLIHPIYTAAPDSRLIYSVTDTGTTETFILNMMQFTVYYYSGFFPLLFWVCVYGGGGGEGGGEGGRCKLYRYQVRHLMTSLIRM